MDGKRDNREVESLTLSGFAQWCWRNYEWNIIRLNCGVVDFSEIRIGSFLVWVENASHNGYEDV